MLVKMDYVKMLMPINIYNNVSIQDGKIKICGHIYESTDIKRYDQQEVNIYELDNEFIIYDHDGIYIASINK